MTGCLSLIQLSMTMKPSHERGYTMIEIVVAAGIFAGVLLVVANIFTFFIFSQRRDISERRLQEDLRFAIEFFSREARTAYASTFAVTGTGDRVTFRNQNGTCVAYHVSNEAWERAEQEGSGVCEDMTYTNYVAITGNNTRMMELVFLIPSDITDGAQLLRQGIITFHMQAASTNASVPTLDLQSSVTSRQVSFFEES